MHSTSSPFVTLQLQVHHHTLFYVIALRPLRHSLPWSLDHTSFKSASPYCTLLHSHGLHFSYNCIAILQSMPLPRVTLVLQIHHNTVLYVTVLGYTTASTSPYSSVNHLPGSHRFYKSTIHISMSLPKVTLPCCITITILHSTSPLWDTLLAVHHHILL